MRKQNVEPDSHGRPLRHRLLDKGIVHSFYKEYLWAMPINGRKVDELNLREVISENS
jgi:hypothetical protein